ncbi:MAG: cysteine protease StiP family protein [Pseudomonadota bacterium]
MNFSGSYRAGDVRFLLKPLPMADFVDVQEKEKLIQSGQRHYSEMLSPESLPSDRYLNVFREACAANLDRMARDCLHLAALIAARRSGAVTLVSLARAGTPVGVVLKHLLPGSTHYSVSIIRDRGIDQVALEHILAAGHTPESIVFVDGWTGKGVISRELASAVAEFNARRGTSIDGGLYVLSDLAGTAACAASCDDYLIPSSILNATVSGLISRSILNDAIGPDDFHGCVYYEQFAPQDQSQAFADALVARARALGTLPDAAPMDKERAAQVSRDYMQAALKLHGILDVNMVKPGIGEATRVLLRRVPRLLILRDEHAPEVAHLTLLAQEKNVPVLVDHALPYHAVSLIRSALDG